MDAAEYVLTKWADYFEARNFKSLVELYADGAIFFGSTPELRIGREEILEYFLKMPNIPGVKVKFGNIVSRNIDPKIIVLACSSQVSVGGRKLCGRFTQTITQNGDEWRIVSHHATDLGAAS
jgi:ketosteroid isomerase-like protein